MLGVPGGSVAKNLPGNCRRCSRHRFDSWVCMISWKRRQQPIPVFLAWKVPWTEEPGGLQSRRLQSLIKLSTHLILTHISIATSVLVIICNGIYFPSFYFHSIYIFGSKLCFLQTVYSLIMCFRHSGHLWVLIGEFNPFTFKVITKGRT